MVETNDAAERQSESPWQARLRAELALGVLPANLDVSKVVKYWHQRAEEAESKLQEKQVEQLRLQT